jgi:hypothetical protein
MDIGIFRLPPLIGQIMKLMEVQKAAGQILCHDVTQIIRGVKKDRLFSKGHVISEEDVPVLLKPMNYGITIGLGCDFYLPIIKVAPEIRFCFGLNNTIEKNRSDLTDFSISKYPNAIAKGVPRMVIFTFNFE